MSFHWSCFIVPSHLEICSFTTILVCLSLLYSVYVQKTKKQKKQKQKTKQNKKRKEKYIKINVHVCVFSISIP